MSFNYQDVDKSRCTRCGKWVYTTIVNTEYINICTDCYKEIYWNSYENNPKLSQKETR